MFPRMWYVLDFSGKMGYDGKTLFMDVTNQFLTCKVFVETG